MNRNGQDGAERSRRYRERHPDRAREATRRWREANREQDIEKQREWRDANRETYRAASRRHTSKLRTAVFDHYGWICACCGTIERLSIDHIDSDGGEHRRQIGYGRPATGPQLHRWLILNGFPPGFQTLCRRCNLSKGNRAGCQLAHGDAS